MFVREAQMMLPGAFYCFHSVVVFDVDLNNFIQALVNSSWSDQGWLAPHFHILSATSYSIFSWAETCLKFNCMSPIFQKNHQELSLLKMYPSFVALGLWQYIQESILNTTSFSHSQLVVYGGLLTPKASLFSFVGSTLAEYILVPNKDNETHIISFGNICSWVFLARKQKTASSFSFSPGNSSLLGIDCSLSGSWWVFLLAL